MGSPLIRMLTVSGTAKNPPGNVTRTRPAISMNPPVELMTFLKTDLDTELRTCGLASVPDRKRTQRISPTFFFLFLPICSNEGGRRRERAKRPPPRCTTKLDVPFDLDSQRTSQ